MDRSFLLVSLMGVYTHCAMGERVKSCHLMSLCQNLTSKQFYDFTKGLSDADLLELYRKHKSCMNQRNNTQLSFNRQYSW